MAAVQTTIKTELCSFCEYRIYPGRGQRFISRDGKVHTFIHSKQARLARQKLKAAKLHWTLVWRRANKKGRGEAAAKRRSRKTGRVEKAIVGLSLEELKRTRAAKPDPTKMRPKLATKEPKDKSKAPKTAAAAGRKNEAPKAKIPKTQTQGQKQTMPRRK